MKILLASKSPRRKELLQSLGYDFEVISVKCDEVYPPNLKAEDIAGYLSALKVNACINISDEDILITADTVVAVDGEVLGKPQNKTEAKEMLRKLSGKTHQVYTGITVKKGNRIVTQTDVASVKIMDLTEEEIEFYIENFQPFDKAGSYGIQEWLGMAKISEIHGSFYNIMGLPTHLLYHILKDFE